MAEESQEYTIRIDGRTLALVDLDTGEVVDPKVLRIVKEVPKGRQYWWRLMLTDLVTVIGDLPGKQVGVVGVVLDNVNPWSNELTLTQQELADKANCSVRTVSNVLKVLRKHDILRLKHKGVYVVNPRFMTQGGGVNKYTTLAFTYQMATPYQMLDGGKDDQDAAQAQEA